jgi:hypothetical protein
MNRSAARVRHANASKARTRSLLVGQFARAVDD